MGRSLQINVRCNSVICEEGGVKQTEAIEVSSLKGDRASVSKLEALYAAEVAPFVAYLKAALVCI